MRDVPLPMDPSGIQRYLGTTNYLGRFMPHLSDKAAPLHKLTHKNVEWEWTEAHKRVVNHIQDIITNQPVFRFYDPAD